MESLESAIPLQDVCDESESNLKLDYFTFGHLKLGYASDSKSSASDTNSSTSESITVDLENTSSRDANNHRSNPNVKNSNQYRGNFKNQNRNRQNVNDNSHNRYTQSTQKHTNRNNDLNDHLNQNMRSQATTVQQSQDSESESQLDYFTDDLIIADNTADLVQQLGKDAIARYSKQYDIVKLQPGPIMANSNAVSKTQPDAAKLSQKKKKKLNDAKLGKFFLNNQSYSYNDKSSSGKEDYDNSKYLLNRMNQNESTPLLLDSDHRNDSELFDDELQQYKTDITAKHSDSEKDSKSGLIVMIIGVVCLCSVALGGGVLFVMIKKKQPGPINADANNKIQSISIQPNRRGASSKSHRYNSQNLSKNEKANASRLNSRASRHQGKVDNNRGQLNHIDAQKYDAEGDQITLDNQNNIANASVNVPDYSLSSAICGICMIFRFCGICALFMNYCWEHHSVKHARHFCKTSCGSCCKTDEGIRRSACIVSLIYWVFFLGAIILFLDPFHLKLIQKLTGGCHENQPKIALHGNAGQNQLDTGVISGTNMMNVNGVQISSDVSFQDSHIDQTNHLELKNGHYYQVFAKSTQPPQSKIDLGEAGLNAGILKQKIDANAAITEKNITGGIYIYKADNLAMKQYQQIANLAGGKIYTEGGSLTRNGDLTLTNGEVNGQVKAALGNLGIDIDSSDGSDGSHLTNSNDNHIVNGNNVVDEDVDDYGEDNLTDEWQKYKSTHFTHIIANNKDGSQLIARKFGTCTIISLIKNDNTHQFQVQQNVPTTGGAITSTKPTLIDPADYAKYGISESGHGGKSFVVKGPPEYNGNSEIMNINVNTDNDQQMIDVGNGQSVKAENPEAGLAGLKAAEKVRAAGGSVAEQRAANKAAMAEVLSRKLAWEQR